MKKHRGSIAALLGVLAAVPLILAAARRGGLTAADSRPPKLAFAFAVNPGRPELEAILLADSIRKFGGGLAGSDIWALAPKTVESVSGPTRDRLAGLGVEVLPYPVEDAALDFPLAAKVFAAAEAEGRAAGRTELLAWLDTDTIVLDEPRAFLLPAGKSLAYRPVMHVLIGSPYDKPEDDFWKLVYERCGAPESRIFPMVTSVDEVRIRPYFNAGCLVLRPEKKILAAWRDNFQQAYLRPEFEAFYKKSGTYAVFVHQAVLAGTILSRLEPAELLELPGDYNYSLQLHSQYPEPKRIRGFDQLKTVRYDQYLYLGINPRWRETVEVKEPFRGWLDGHLGILGVKALLYLGQKYGANYYLNRDLIEENGWTIATVGSAPSVEPCNFIAQRFNVPPFKLGLLLSDVLYPDFYDALAIMPASSADQPDPFRELMAGPDDMDVLKKAVARGVAVSTICSGGRVLAAADVLRGKPIVGEPKFKSEYDAAGAVFAGKDHPPVIAGNIVTGARDQYYDYANVMALATAVENRMPRGERSDRTPLLRTDFAQKAALGAGETLWGWNIGGAGADGVRDVAETPDGGYLLAGFTFSQGTGDSDALAVRTDAGGKLLWAKNYGGAGMEYANACLRLPDGFLLVGYTTSAGAGSKDILVLKIDDRGREVWTRTFGGPSWDVGTGAALAADGIVIAGFTHSDGAGEEDVRLSKLDFHGNEIWSRTFGGARSEISNSVCVLADGGIAVGAVTGTFGGGNCDFWFIRTDASGRELWTKTYGAQTAPDAPAGRTPFDWCRDMRPASDGGFLLTGTTNSRPLEGVWAVRTDGDGRVLWSKSFGRERFMDFGRAAAETPDGGFVIGATAKSNLDDNDVYLIRVDRRGETLWEKVLSGRGSDRLGALKVNGAGEIVVAGQTTTAGMMGSIDVFLLKVKPDRRRRSGASPGPAERTSPGIGLSP
ncbi:MAG: DJ-1/PfpI family protein [Candidatus Aminicenantes bacterium]|nr:DJ-1/PfpI family protein [Candidatus Aminicenantes bacterium]